MTTLECAKNAKAKKVNAERVAGEGALVPWVSDVLCRDDTISLRAQWQRLLYVIAIPPTVLCP